VELELARRAVAARLPRLHAWLGPLDLGAFIAPWVDALLAGQVRSFPPQQPNFVLIPPR
jgi:hypothetical protein